MTANTRLRFRCQLLTTCMLVLMALLTNMGFAQAPAEIEGYRLLYVPAENLDTVLHKDAKGVFLPQDEFRKLVQKAKANQAQFGDRPAYVVASQINYSARIESEQLVIDVTGKLESTVTGWTELLLPVEGLSIEQISLDGAAAPAARDSTNLNQLHLFFEKPGSYQLKATFSAPLISVGSDQAVGFSLLPAPAATMNVQVPAGSFLLVDGLQLKRPKPNDQPAEYAIAVGGRPRIQLQFTGRQATERADVLTLANTAFGVRVTPGDVAWSARTQLQVFGRPVNRLVCQVPSTLEITNVESSGLESWELSDTEGDATTTTITLNFRQPIDGSRPIAFQGVVRVEPGQEWNVPQLEIEGVASHVGVIRVDFPPGVRVRTDQLQGVRQVTGADLTAEIAPATPGDQSLVFQVWKPDFKLTFTTETKAREVQAAVTTLVDVNDQSVDLATTATLETRFAPLFDVLVSLPAGWQVLSTRIGDQPVDYQVLPNEAGTQLLRLALPSPLAPGDTRTVQINARLIPENWPLEESTQRLPLPDVKFPQAGVVEGLYGITSSAGLEAIPVELNGLDIARAADMAVLQQKLGPLAGNLRQGFTYQDGQVSGQMDTTRKPPRTSVSTRSFFRIDPDSLFCRIEADITLNGGGVRKLSLTLPEQAGIDLRFTVVAQAEPDQASASEVQIIEQTSSEPANGLRTWTLRFDRFLVGPHLLAVDLRMPRSGDSFTMPQLRFQGAERENGYVAIEADEDQFIIPQAVDAALRPLPPVDPVDVPLGLYHPQKRIVAAYFADRGGWQVAVKEQSFARTAIPTAIVHSASLNTVIGEDGDWQSQADVVFSAVGIQGFQVQAEQAELWAAMIDGAPVEVRRQRDEFLIPVKESADQQRHTLRLLYRTPGRLTSKTQAGRIQQQPPRIQVVDGAGRTQPLEVLDQQWTVYFPDQWVLTTSRGTFRPAHQLTSTGLVTSFWRAISAPRPRSIGQAAGLVVLIFGLAWLIRSMVRNVSSPHATRWRWVLAGTAVLVSAGLAWLVLPSSRQVSSVARGRGGSTHPESREFSSSNAPLATASPNSGGPESPMTWEMGTPSTSGEAKELPEQLSRPDVAPLSGPEKSRFDITTMRSKRRDQQEKESARPGIAYDRAQKQPGLKEMKDQPQTDPFGAPATPSPVPAASTIPNVESNAPLADTPVAGRMGYSDGAAKRAPLNPADSSNDSLTIRQSQEISGSDKWGDQYGDGIFVGNQRSGFSHSAGLLSLNAQILVPERMDQETFHHHGEDGVTGPSSAPALDFTYQRTGLTNTRTWVVASGLLLLTWFLRSCRRIAWSVLILLLLLPIGIAPLFPATVQDIFDGLFFGSLGGMILLIACFVCRLIRDALSWCRLRRMTASTTAGLVALLAVTSLAMADDGPPDVDPQALVVPYGGEDPLTAFRVFVPQETYLKLYSQANPGETVKTASPVSAVISESLYSVALEPDAVTPTALVKGRFLIESFSESQTRVSLPLHAVALKSARLADKPASIVIENNRPVLILSGKGKSVLDVEFEIPVESTGPAGRFTLQIDPSPAGRMSFELPAPELEVRLNGTTSAYRRRTADNKTYVELPVDRGGTIALNWQPKEMKGVDAATIQVETAIAAVFDDRGLLASNGFLIRARQGTVSEMLFAMPADVSLKQISGPDVGGWQLDEAADRPILRVFFRRPVDNETSVKIDLFRSLTLDEGQNVTVPELVPQDVTREVGQIAIFAEEQLSVRIGEVIGAAQIDVARFAPASEVSRPQSGPRAVYRFTSRPAKIVVAPSRRQAETVVAAEHGIYVSLRKQLVASRFQYTLSGAPRASVSFALPVGYLPIEVEAGDALSDWYTSTAGEGESQILTVEFTGPRSGDQEVTLQGRISRPADVGNANLSVPRPLELTRSTAIVGIWFDDIFSASIRDLPDTWKSVPIDQVSGHLQGLQPRPVQFLFRSTSSELPVMTFDLTRNVPQLSGDSITLLAVSDTSLDYGLTLRWRITRAAADTFQFVTSPWLAGRLQFQDPQIRQVLSSDLNGSTRWTITLNEPVRDEYLLSAIATLPPAADEIVQFPTIQLEQATQAATLTELETQRHFGVLVNLSSRQLAPLNAGSVNSINRGSLPFVLQDELLEQAMEVVELPGGGKGPQWKSQRAEEVQGTLATVTGADLVTVFDHDGSWKTRVDYTVRSRGQQFLGVRLPDRSRLLASVVKEQPSRTVVTTLGPGEIHLVPLPETNVSDLSFKITLIIAGNVGGRFHDQLALRAQSFDVPAPHVISRTESETFGMTVAQTLWTVFVPQDFDVSPISDSSRNNMMEEQDEDFRATRELQGAQRQLTDVLDLLRVSNSEKYSASQRLNSANNLKQLNLYFDTFQSQSWQVQGDNRQRFDDFFAENGSLIEQARKASEQEAVTWTRQQNPNAQDFVAGNTLLLNSSNKGAEVQAGSGSADVAKSEQEFRFKSNIPEAAKKQDGLENSRGKLRSQIQNQAPVQQSLEGLDFGATKSDDSAPVKSGGAGGYRLERQQQYGNMPAGGGMGGGLGGMGGGDFDANGVVPVDKASVVDQKGRRQVDPGEAKPQWSGGAGLSLNFDVPRSGQSMHFTKVGGNPKLAIAARPLKTRDQLQTLAWTALWLVLAAVLFRLIQRRDVGDQIARIAPVGLIVVGLMLYIYGASEGQLIAVIVWTVTAVWYVAGARKRPSAT